MLQLTPEAHSHELSRWLATGLAVVGLFTAGCGGAAEQKIDTPTLASTLRGVGFRPLSVQINRIEMARFAKEFGRPDLASNSLDADYLHTRGASPMLMALTAVRLPNASAAKRTFANNQPLLNNRLSAAERRLPPRGFLPSRLREVRVCNVVLTSYNPQENRALTFRFDRAVNLLRKMC